MGVRRPDYLAPEHARQCVIRGILCLTQHLFLSVDSGYPCTDDVIILHILHIATPLSFAAADLTDSNIFV